MNPTNPTQIDPDFLIWGPTWPSLSRICILGGPTLPNIRFKLGSFEFIKYIIELNPNLNPFWGQLYPIGPVFQPWGPTRPDSTQILVPNLGSTQKNGSGLAALDKTYVLDKTSSE